MKNWYFSPALLATAALGTGLSVHALAQGETGGHSSRAGYQVLEEVVVTARRREELLQDVPASLTVFNQQQLNDANITNPSELATYTPSLQINNRFGDDNATFAIRGFSQELRTTASVGVYFAEVIALRGANSQQSGDGATPGDFFDLANVQVLKGPTGTLFGRNTTGGAVLLTPQRPTDSFEGYVEGSVGNYDMWRGQAVVNVPVTDGFALRLGIDHQERDGYLDNFSGIGPDKFADVDYTAYRLSALWSITDSLENYTILRYAKSQNNGYPSTLLGCNEDEFLGALCAPDLADRQANGNDGFYDVYNNVPKPVNDQEFAHAINTTTWDVTDNYLIKNIIAYGTLQTDQRADLFGVHWVRDGVPVIFQQVGLAENFHTTDQETFVEELQVQGSSFDQRLTWQAGLYFEKSEPRDDYGAQSPALISCDQNSIISSNPEDFRCNNVLGIGALQSVPGGATYTNKAVYAQGTYDFSDEWSATLGLRYTDDKTKGHANDVVYKFASGSYGPPVSATEDFRRPSADSSEPTWLVGVDYKPLDDTLIYAKYSRGYRQGSVNLGGSTGLDVHDPETVDTYEIGTKLRFHGAMPATFNLAAFYNDFTDQQVQYGYFKTSGVGTTAIVNAGSSTLWGVEVDGNLQLTESLIFNASYAYLNTEVDKLVNPEAPPGAALTGLSTTTAEGEPLSFVPENKVVLTGIWRIPVDSDLGDMDLSVTYVWTDKMQAVSKETSIFATLDDYNLVNVNFNWGSLFNSNFDFSVFVTNATDEKYLNYVAGLWTNGLENGHTGAPRMYGARIRYNFGER